jgi:hypothetical protein
MIISLSAGSLVDENLQLTIGGKSVKYAQFCYPELSAHVNPSHPSLGNLESRAETIMINEIPQKYHRNTTEIYIKHDQKFVLSFLVKASIAYCYLTDLNFYGARATWFNAQCS